MISKYKLVSSHVNRVIKTNSISHSEFFLTRARNFGCSSSVKAEAEKSAKLSTDNIQHEVAPTSKTHLTNIPFVKNLFLGKYDPKILVFPEALSKEEVNTFNQFIVPIEKFFNEEIDSKVIDEKCCIPESVMKKLKEFGLFGLQIPTELGGQSLNATSLARLSEVLSLDTSVHRMLSAHQSLGLKSLLLVGSEQQKSKYLPKLATGEHIAAFCLCERNSGSDAASIVCTAKLSEDQKFYILDGEKTWVTNGANADVFTVFAKTSMKTGPGTKEEKLSTFLVEKSFGGITVSEPNATLGLRGVPTYTVKFDKTPVPVENVLGELGGGFQNAIQILNSDIFTTGSAYAGILKQLTKIATKHAIEQKRFGHSLKDLKLIQEKFARIAMNIYAMESTSYVTAGIIDSCAHPDVACESAAVKIFSSEALLESADDLLQIMGSIGYNRDHPFERLLRDARAFTLVDSTNEILRLYIALNGLQHAIYEFQDTVVKMRNPLNNIGFVMRKSFERMQTDRKKPALLLKLYNHVHPDLSTCGEELEMRVVKLQFIVTKYWSTYGNNLSDLQLALKRFADVVIDLFVITCCLSRATRSKCIGLKNHDHEVLMARTITIDLLKRVDVLINELDIGEVNNGDPNLEKIAETVFKNHGYAAEHPLTRNW